MKALKWLNLHFEEVIMIGLLAMMATVMTVQVIVRYIFQNPLTWAEEFCRYCQIWSTFVSIGYCTQRGIMLRVDVLTKVLPQMLQRVVEVIIKLVILVVYAFFFYQSFSLVGDAWTSQQVSPAMGLPMYILYSITTFGFGMGILRGIQDLILYLHSGGKQTAEGGAQ